MTACLMVTGKERQRAVPLTTEWGVGRYSTQWRRGHWHRPWYSCKTMVSFPIRVLIKQLHRADLWNFPYQTVYKVIRSREILPCKRKKTSFQAMLWQRESILPCLVPVSPIPQAVDLTSKKTSGKCGYDSPSPREILQKTLDSECVWKVLRGNIAPHDKRDCGDIE